MLLCLKDWELKLKEKINNKWEKKQKKQEVNTINNFIEILKNANKKWIQIKICKNIKLFMIYFKLIYYLM